LLFVTTPPGPVSRSTAHEKSALSVFAGSALKLS
jgi:hypothetical protein